MLYLFLKLMNNFDLMFGLLFALFEIKMNSVINKVIFIFKGDEYF